MAIKALTAGCGAQSKVGQMQEDKFSFPLVGIQDQMAGRIPDEGIGWHYLSILSHNTRGNLGQS